MKKTQRQIVFEKALEYAKKNLKEIKVTGVDYDGSQKCHHVARNKAPKYLVVSALSFVPNSGVNVHFINKGEDYMDNTLGYLAERNTFYLLKEYEFKEVENADMTKLLMDLKKEILAKLFTAKELLEHGITVEHI